MKKIILLIGITCYLSTALKAQSPGALFGGASETCVGLDFSQKAPPNGRFLFQTVWVRGALLTADNRFLRNDSILYNFDKVSQDLVFTVDKNMMLTADKREFKSVTLFCHDEVYTFEHLYSVDKTDLFQVLVKSPSRYSLYKRVRTLIINGAFEDHCTYYLVTPMGPVERIYTLSVKAVSHAFALGTDIQKVNEFCALYCQNGLNEAYLKSLVNYLNDQPAVAIH